MKGIRFFKHQSVDLTFTRIYYADTYKNLQMWKFCFWKTLIDCVL